MAITSEQFFIDDLVKGINEAVEKEVGRRFDEQVEILKRAKPEIVAGILLNITSRLQMENHMQQVVLTIKKEF